MRTLIAALALACLFFAVNPIRAQEPSNPLAYPYVPTLPVRPIWQTSGPLPARPLSSVTYPLNESVFRSRQRFYDNAQMWMWTEWHDPYGNSFIQYRQYGPWGW